MTTTGIEIECTRALLDTVEVREINDEKRAATFVAATENGVDTWQGREYLRMTGGDFARYRRNPVVLDTHNRWEAGAIVGQAAVKVEGRKLVAVVTFAETERAETIWQLVRDGFLRALSVGFLAHEVEVLAEGEMSGRGANRIEGPARVVVKWELYEISVVPVPADAEALRRGFFDRRDDFRANAESLIGDLQRLVNTSEVRSMANEPDEKLQTGEPPADQPADKPTSDAGAPVETPDAPPTKEELRARDLKARKDAILAITPRGLETIAEECVLEGLDIDASRERLRAAYTKKRAPVGTPSTDGLGEPKGPAEGEQKVEDVSDQELTRALCG